MAEEILSAPSHPTHPKLWGYQWPGIIFLLLLPILALAGVFGERSKQEKITGGRLVVELTYPSLIRYGQDGVMRFKILNASSERIESLRLRIEDDYISSFSSVSTFPAVLENHGLSLGPLEPREEQGFSIEFTAEKAGRHRGHASILVGGKPEINFELNTIIFP